MKISRFLNTIFIVLTAFYAQAVFAVVINVDIEGNPSITYSGDDGILSTSGGTVWNSVPHFVGTSSLLDEFGNVTGVGVSWPGSDFGVATDANSTNSLQDSGTWGGGFDITGLLPGTTYALAIYAMENAGGAVIDASGGAFDFWTTSGPLTYNMPGTAGADYALYTGLVPFDLGGGIFGIRLTNFDGAVTGVQLDGAVVPVPAAVWLFGSGLLGLIGIARRKKA